MSKLRIIEISACSNKVAASKLQITADKSARIALMLKMIVEKGHYDIIAVSEMPFTTLQQLKENRIMTGYSTFYHHSFEEEREKWRFTCLKVLFVKNGIDFIPEDRSDFETIYRCVAGKLNFDGQDIFYKTNHVPCVDNGDNEAQLRRKESFLEDELCFQNKELNTLAISAGDFNASKGGDEDYSEYLDLFKFKDLVTVPTYGNKQLDHCFISPAFEESPITVSVNVLNDLYKIFTDHKPIEIVLSA